MRWAENVARMGDRRGANSFGAGDLRERDLDVDRRIKLKCIFKK
jgi:hypothetical protein